VVIGTEEDQIVQRIVLRFRILHCMVDLEGTATNPIPAETTDAIGSIKNGIYDFSPDRSAVDPFLDESYVGLTVIQLERLIRQGAERADGMPMRSDSCDQIRVESETKKGSVSSAMHAGAGSIVSTQDLVSRA
jgi:hypothetical protein